MIDEFGEDRYDEGPPAAKQGVKIKVSLVTRLVLGIAKAILKKLKRRRFYNGR